MENIQFRLVGVHTVQFATIDVGEVYEEDIAIGSDFGYGLDIENSTFACQYKAQLFSKKDLFLIVEVVCNFYLKPASLKKLKVKNKKQYKFPLEFVKNLTEVTVSTARGVLHAKTEGNKYQRFVLPIVDVNVVNADLTMDY